MSAFLVSDRCMHRCVSLITNYLQTGGGATFGGETAVSHEGMDRIGRQLYAMNARAVNHRYNEDDKPPGYAYSPFHENDPDIVKHKALRCLLYQCSEGDVPESDLFKEADRVADAVAGQLFSSTATWRDADGWG